MFDNGSIQNDIGLISRIQSWKKESFPSSSHTACLIEFQVVDNGPISFSLNDVNITNSLFEDIEFKIESVTLNNKDNSNNNANDPIIPVDDTNADDDEDSNETGDSNETSLNDDLENSNGEDGTDIPGDEGSNTEVDETGEEESDLAGTKVSQTGLDNNFIPLIIIICVVSIFLIIYRYRKKI